MELQTSQDGSRASLKGLGADVLILIVDYLDIPDIASLRLVNSYINSVSKYGLYRDMSFNLIDDVKMLSQRLLLLEEHGLLAAVRTVKISDVTQKLCRTSANTRVESGRSTDAIAVAKQIESLCQYIPRMTGLRYVHLRVCDMPIELLSRLKTCKGIQLAVRAESCGEIGPFLPPLSSNDNLCALDMQSGGAPRPLRKILRTCPNLRSLRIDVSSASNDPSYHHFWMTKEEYEIDWEHTPMLEELEIIGHPFGIRENQRTIFQAYPAYWHEEDYWAEKFDWSRLRSLRSHDYSFARKLLPKLSSLRELGLRAVATEKKIAESALMALPTNLKTLELDTRSRLDVRSIIRQGSSLRKLRLHCPEQSDVPWQTSILLINDIKIIAEHCPNIEILALNMPRKNGDWPYDTLDILSTFRRLKHLTLWFELGINAPFDLPKPYVTFPASAKLFKYLRKGNDRLQKLTVHSGSLAGPISLPYGTVDWDWRPYNTCEVFECTLSERDDEAAKGVFTTSCTSMHAEENELLRRALIHCPDGNETFSSALRAVFGGEEEIRREKLPWFTGRYELAWEGPHRMERQRYANIRPRVVEAGCTRFST